MCTEEIDPILMVSYVRGHRGEETIVLGKNAPGWGISPHQHSVSTMLSKEEISRQLSSTGQQLWER